ncbi:MAG: hypothetical protein JWP06_576 [Candidatus Saccharibacteria bacterium]|nr:hypothetical protein [Candidatus Saccharibacteria bacterium]
MIHTILGFLTLFLAIVSYSLYFRGIFKGNTRPHGVTWFIWSALNALVFYQQLTHDAGPGAWVTGAAAVANFCVFLFSFKYGERTVTRFDQACLVLAGVSITSLIYNMGSDLSVILASTTFIIGFGPTLYKSFRKPLEETAATFGLNSIKFLIALFALSSFTITTAVYPTVLFIVNAFFAVFLFVRRSSSYCNEPKD